MQPLEPSLTGEPAKPINEVLPEIDGIDVVGALKRLNGNRQLYKDLLLGFADKQHGLTSQILTAIHKGDNKLAARIVHTVKGVAGNIGLEKLFRVTKSLEHALRHGEPSLPALAEEFSQVASHQVQAIQQAMADVIQGPAPGAATSATLDLQVANQAVTQLRELLKANDSDAVEAFQAVDSILTGTVDRSRLDALRKAISEFDFDGAGRKLREITDEYGAHWEQPR